MMGLVLLGVDRPGIFGFIQKVITVMTNVKLSTEQKMALIQTAAVELIGLWADLSQQAAIEDKIEEIKKI
jgi:hypothetical protein